MQTILGKPTALDFFSGSGLVTEGLKRHFDVIWANDICRKKNAVYCANFKHSHLAGMPIQDIHGAVVPRADLAWASFPCQDLSLAGNLAGMSGGTRSSLFWEWIRVIDEMPAKPPVLAVENVIGFLVAHDSKHFKLAYMALKERGYLAGALEIDAVDFLPQSRPRCFLVAAKRDAVIGRLVSPAPDPHFHTKSVVAARYAVADDEWLWWRLPTPPRRIPALLDLAEKDAPFHSVGETERLISMLSDINRRKLDDALSRQQLLVGTGYRRVRKERDGNKAQRLEVRFDGIAGCLRTPNGGSSRQIVLIVEKGRVRTRLMTPRETARLMGAPDTYKLEGSYNDQYRAMGDAVAVPVTRWLSEHLLAPLTVRSARAQGLDRRVLQHA